MKVASLTALPWGEKTLAFCLLRMYQYFLAVAILAQVIFGSSKTPSFSSVARTTLSPSLPGPRSPFALMAGSPSREDHAKRPRHELGMDSPFTPLLNRQHANG